MEGSGQLHAPAAGWEAGCAPQSVWKLWQGEKKILPLEETES